MDQIYEKIIKPMHRFSNYRLTVAVFGLQFQKKFVKTSEKVQKSKFLIFFEASEKCFALNFDNILTWEPNRIISVFGFNSSNEKIEREQCDQIGRFLFFGQLFKACGNNYFAQIAHIFRQSL